MEKPVILKSEIRWALAKSDRTAEPDEIAIKILLALNDLGDQ